MQGRSIKSFSTSFCHQSGSTGLDWTVDRLNFVGRGSGFSVVLRLRSLLASQDAGEADLGQTRILLAGRNALLDEHEGWRNGVEDDAEIEQI